MTPLWKHISALCRDMLWHLHSIGSHQPEPSRPSLIDLGPLALLQTALTIVVVPLLGRARIGAELASLLLSLPCHAMQGLVAPRRKWGLPRSLPQVQRMVNLLVWQALSLIMAAFAFKQRTQTVLPPKAVCQDLMISDFHSAAPCRAISDHSIPAFSLQIQCRQCLQKEQRIYDARGYPIFLK